MDECSYTSASLNAFAVWTGNTARVTENRLDVDDESQLFNSVYGRNWDIRESHETLRLNYAVLRRRIYQYYSWRCM